MKIINQEYPIHNELQLYFTRTSIDRIIFFDIETTGLFSQHHSIYLIGCLYVYDNKFMLTQFLAENINDEKEILIRFLDLIKKFDLYINYNGNTFDIPFINKRLNKHALACAKIDKNNSFDLFQWIKENKKELNLINYKLKTVERFLGIYRKDLFSGGELIEQFFQYTQTKDLSLEKNLLMHNSEDIYHMPRLLRIMDYTTEYRNYKQFSDLAYKEIHAGGKLILEVDLETVSRDDFIIESESSIILWDNQKKFFSLTSSIYELELFYYYTDYKNYYYIPSRDEALHKSIAKYLDLSDKQLAKASNCYTKTEGFFIENMLSSFCFPLCKRSYKDPSYFIPLEFEMGKTKLKREFVLKLIYEILKP